MDPKDGENDSPLADLPLFSDDPAQRRPGAGPDSRPGARTGAPGDAEEYAEGAEGGPARGAAQGRDTGTPASGGRRAAAGQRAASGPDRLEPAEPWSEEDPLGRGPDDRLGDDFGLDDDFRHAPDPGGAAGVGVFDAADPFVEPPADHRVGHRGDDDFEPTGERVPLRGAASPRGRGEPGRGASDPLDGPGLDGPEDSAAAGEEPLARPGRRRSRGLELPLFPAAGGDEEGTGHPGTGRSRQSQSRTGQPGTGQSGTGQPATGAPRRGPAETELWPLSAPAGAPAGAATRAAADPADLELDAPFPTESLAEPGAEPGGTRGPESPAARRGAPAPVSARLAAGALDLALLLAAGGLAVIGAWTLDVPLGLAGLSGLAVFVAVFSFAYAVVPLAFWGRTPGMALVGVTARSSDGGPLTFGQVGLRWLGALLTLALAGLPLLLALAPLGGRSLSDRLSGSNTIAA